MLQSLIGFALFIIIGLWIKRDKNAPKRKLPLSERLLEVVVGIVTAAILIGMFVFGYWLFHTYPVAGFLLLAGLLTWAWYDNRGKKKDQR